MPSSFVNRGCSKSMAVKKLGSRTNYFVGYAFSGHGLQPVRLSAGIISSIIRKSLHRGIAESGCLDFNLVLGVGNHWENYATLSM